MRIRTVMLGAVLAGLAIVPVSAPAAQNGVGLYSISGTLTVIPKSEGPGSWSMSGGLALQVSARPAGPKSGTLTAGGLLGPVSVPADPCELTATTGAFSIAWAGGLHSSGRLVHPMNHPVHSFAASVRSGYRAGGNALIVIRHQPNNRFSGFMAGPHPEPPT